MPPLSSILLLIHLVGLALGAGAATAKLSLLLRCRVDRGFLPTYLAVARPITRLIVAGLVLLTLSGAGWLLLGYPVTPRLVAKLVLVGTLWVMGPIIDNVVEPGFRQLAPAPGEPAPSGFHRIQRRYVMLETAATAMFYVVIVMWLVF